MQINAFREDDNCSIFITGSNAYLLSGELTTKLTGRYLEFDVGTLSFSEYIEIKNLLKPSVIKLLDASYDLWLSKGIKDWGIVLDD